eukprot:m.284097 g.284097  ORF g.284097 m.284097 type:complete len:395 (-) comp22909_c1_seq2:1207-2391(-)
MTENLFSVDYPIYTVGTTSTGLLVVAGGGGQAKTGVPNVIELYALVGGKARSVSRLNDVAGAVMNMDIHPRVDVAAVGIEGTMRLFSLGTEDSSGPRKGRAYQRTAATAAPAIAPVGLQFTDQGGSGFQNVVRFSSDGSRLATGGSDGMVRLWDYPSLRLLCTIAAHGQQNPPPADVEIEDLDFDPLGSMVVSVSSSPFACVWRTIDGQRMSQISWLADRSLDSPAYNFKYCRFASVRGKCRLFTGMVPTSRKQSFVVAWENVEGVWQEQHRAPLGQDPVCSMATSADGRFVACGSTEGHITVLSTEDLSVVTKVRAHGLFVTDLAFLAEAGSAGSVISVSADRYCVRTPIVDKSSSHQLIGLFILMLIFVVVLFTWPGLLFGVDENPVTHLEV